MWACAGCAVHAQIRQVLLESLVVLFCVPFRFLNMTSGLRGVHVRMCKIVRGKVH